MWACSPFDPCMINIGLKNSLGFKFLFQMFINIFKIIQKATIATKMLRKIMHMKASQRIVFKLKYALCRHSVARYQAVQQSHHGSLRARHAGNVRKNVHNSKLLAYGPVIKYQICPADASVVSNYWGCSAVTINTGR